MKNQETKKRNYQTPKLKNLGKVSTLTLGGSSGNPLL